MRRLIAAGLMLGGMGVQAQQPVGTAPVAAAPLVSPQAAYDDASRPVDIVRKSIANWSDAEMNALGVAMKKAAIACGERKAAMYGGDDLVALSKLCSFGQQWPAAKEAAALYIGADVPPEGPGKTQLSLAYGLQLDAALHMHDMKEIVADANAMLAGVAYDANVNTAADDAVSYMQLAYTDEAIKLETIRQPLLLAALAAEKPVIPRRNLYASGLAEAELLQYMNRPDDAAASVARLDAALGDVTKISTDDMAPIGEVRKQYGLLGNPLPKLTLSLSLANPTEVPAFDPQFGAGTALLLFPDWCAQCVGMRRDLWKAEQTKQGIVRLYVLLAEKTPDKDALAAEALAPRPGSAGSLPTHDDKAVMNGAPRESPEKLKTPSELLLNTQTLVVPPETTELFAAGDFPFVVMVDYAGIVRFAGSAPETALRPGDFLDRLVEHVAEFWPPPGKTVAER